MSMEKEFNLWLRRPEKTFQERLEFALKAWQSAEFTLLGKYELVLSWFMEEAAELRINSLQEFPLDEFAKLLQLRAQPGLVAAKLKYDFIRCVLQLVKSWTQFETTNSRLLPELLQHLLSFELLQDVFRSEYVLHGATYALLLTQYEHHLRRQTKLLLAHEAAFFGSIMSALRDNAKRASHLLAYDLQYRQTVLPALAQTLLVLQQHELDYSADFNALEQLLSESLSEVQLLKRLRAVPLHARLRALDSAIYNRHVEQPFLQALLLDSFGELTPQANKTDMLSTAAYTLELLRRHDVKLNFKMQPDDVSALNFIGQRVLDYVQQCRQCQLVAVLQLLCAALRYNPLILENCVFRVTSWMLLAEKSLGSLELQMYEEYLLLFIDMYRRLSRAEKFVAHLLRALSEECKISEERKEEQAQQELTQPHDFYMQLLFKEVKVQAQVRLPKSKQDMCNFPQLSTHWPYESVGLAFSQLVATQVTKASLVVWKSLLYGLKELLESLNEPLSPLALIQLELHAALLCQYYDGARLAEHWHQQYKEINALRDFAAEILGCFGRFLLAHAHDQRAMSAFLECCYHAGNSELVLIYYRPDSVLEPQLETETCEKLQAYLTPQEWTLLQQRVLNFGQERCKYLLQRLRQQRQISVLLLKDAEHMGLTDSLLTLEDQQTLFSTLDDAHAQWLVPHMSREDKTQVIAQLWECADTNLWQVFAADLEALALIAIMAYEQLSVAFAAKNKSGTSMLNAAGCDFDRLRQQLGATDLGVADADQALTQLVQAIKLQPVDYKLKRVPVGTVQRLLQLQQQLRFKLLRHELKTLLFGLQLALYSDLRAAQNDELAAEVCQTLTGAVYKQRDGKIVELKLR